MQYLIFDTETSGFPSKQIHPTHPAQARVIQIAALLYDEHWNEIKQLYTLIKPPFSDFKIAQGAFDAHGISIERCRSEGRDGFEVIKEFIEMFEQADCVIAHNFSFDDTMLNIELGNIKNEALKSAMLDAWELADYYCTMELTTDIMKLPFTSGRRFGTKYKWPKLSEAYKHFIGKELVGSHDSLNDCRATAELFKHLLQCKLISLDELRLAI